MTVATSNSEISDTVNRLSHHASKPQPLEANVDNPAFIKFCHGFANEYVRQFQVTTRLRESVKYNDAVYEGDRAYKRGTLFAFLTQVALLGEIGYLLFR